MVELGLTVEPAPPLSTCKTAWTTPLILAVLFFLWVDVQHPSAAVSPEHGCSSALLDLLRLWPWSTA